MAAAANPLVSLYEYLHSVYDGDMDYVDGLLEERNLGENAHSDLQSELITLFRVHRDEWKVRAFVEQRVQITPTRFRVPDLCVMPIHWKRTPIVTEAPLLCIEVLSPEDRMGRMRTRCEDYFRLGVPVVWIFDPAQREAMVLLPDGSLTTRSEGSIGIEGTPIEVSLSAVFSVLDDPEEQ